MAKRPLGAAAARPRCVPCASVTVTTESSTVAPLTVRTEPLS